MGEDPRNMLDWHSSREDVKKRKEKDFKNNDRHNFLFLPQHLREVHRESGSAVGLTSTRQKTPLASENKRLHREREKKAPVCLRLTFPSRLKSPCAHFLSSTHTRGLATWKPPRAAASEGQDGASGRMQVIRANRRTAPVNGSFLISFGGIHMN